jgi:phosphoenolpyruvate phosphomutase
MSCELLHVGHIRAIQYCSLFGEVIIGLLSDECIKKYKGHKPAMPYEEREELLSYLPDVSGVVKQDQLYMGGLLKYLDIDVVASGDGFEPDEEDSIKDAGCRKLNIILPKEEGTGKEHSTTKLKKKICES